MNAAATVTATTAIDSRRKKKLLEVALLLVAVVANLFVMVTVFVLKLCDVEDDDLMAT